LIVTGGVCCLTLAATIGLALPTPSPEQSDTFQLLEGLISAMLLVFVWGGFRVVRPRWTVAEAIVVPMVWGLLVAALGFWFSYLQAPPDEARRAVLLVGWLLA